MNTTIAVTKQVTTLINILTVEPENQSKLIELLRDCTENVITKLDGWISTSFIAAMDRRHVAIYSQWRDATHRCKERCRPIPICSLTFRSSQRWPRSTASPATLSTTTTPDEGEHTSKFASHE